MSRQTTATTSTAALRANLARLRGHAPRARVWAVVKADAYGHGLLAAAQGLADADGLALLEFDGALRLRAAGWDKPILMIEGAFAAADLQLAAAHDLTVVVHGERQAAWFADYAGPPLPVLLKINSGLNRLGVPLAAAAGMARRLAGCSGVRLLGLMTHFADADVAGGATAPIAAFDRATAGLPGSRSLANSAALLAVPASHRDWVRPGIALYGATPFADRSAASFGLVPAMRLTGSLLTVQQLAAGDRVGYGSAFTAPAPMRIGIVDCGYADGYPRLAPTGTPVAVAGVRTRTVGRVSMDMLAVDLTPVPDAGPGAPVELWGETIPVDEVAAAAGTIGYELLCAVAARVRRVTV
ncbi:MAG: alanine racemase [Lautropia sp.]